MFHYIDCDFDGLLTYNDFQRIREQFINRDKDPSQTPSAQTPGPSANAYNTMANNVNQKTEYDMM